MMSETSDPAREAADLRDVIERKCSIHCLNDQVATFKGGAWLHPFGGEVCPASTERTRWFELRKQLGDNTPRH